METKFTPGPWETDGLRIKAKVLFCETRLGVARMEHFVPATERQATARLIAAAPDLLEVAYQSLALIGAIPHGDNCFVSSHYEGDPGDRCNCGKDSAIEALDAAIDKATGEQA